LLHSGADSAREEKKAMIIQYTGYQPDPNLRSYTFQVREGAANVRNFTLSVKTQSLSECKFKDQDIPDLCYAMMKKNLAAETAAQPLPLFATISDLELRVYKDEHYPAKKKAFKPE
jgi:hypothetical protein